MPDARCTRGLVCTLMGRTHTSNNEYTGVTRHSRTRVVLTVSFVLSPVTGLVCHRHLRNTFRKLDTSVGCQDHTTSPSASAPFVKGASASIASRTQRP
jgi:hypothetical protein